METVKGRGIMMVALYLETFLVEWKLFEVKRAVLLEIPLKPS